jgi:hypothetical protein
MLKDDKLIAQFKRHLGISKGKLAKQYSNTKRCQAFYAGDIMSYKDTVSYVDQSGRARKTLVKFNKVKPYVNSVKGFMAQNRRRPKYEARIENSKLQELFSGYANSISDYCRDNANADQIETQQDGDLLMVGYGAVETALSYGEGYISSETDGEYLMGRLDPLSVGWDPFARAPNLLDSRWVYYCKEYALDTALKLFDDSEADDFQEVAADNAEQNNYEYFPNGGRYDKIAEISGGGAQNVEWANKDDKTVKVYFYQWYDVETYYKLANPLFGIDDPDTMRFADVWMQMFAKEQDDSFNPRAETISVSEKGLAALEEYFGDLMTDAYEFKRKVYYTAVLSGDTVFTKYRSISQQGYTIQFKTGDWDAANGIWTGMVNGMMEPALYFNKALTELMFAIAANSKGGVIYEKSAIDDIEDFEKNYSRTDGNVEVNDGALSGGAIQPKAKALVPTGLDAILNIADKSMSDVNGFDPTFMGSREFANDTALFQRQRIKQVMSTLACYFDAATLYQKMSARISLDLIKVFVQNNENMVIRVTGEEGRAMFLRLSQGQLSAEYDVTVGEAPLTQQDKQEQAQILNGMADKLLAGGDVQTAKVLYGMAIELMPLEFALKERAKEVFDPAKKQVDPAYVQQLEDLVKKLQDAGNQAQLQLLAAEAEKTLANAAKARAETTKTLEQSKQVAIENDLAPIASKIQVNI